MASPPPTAAVPGGESPSPSTAVETDAQREEALDRMLTRLAFADDAGLPPLLARVLPYAISSLASPSPSLRKLVIEILSHINKRVKHRPEIELPMMELWRIYTEASTSPMVRNICIVYVEMAFDRLTTENKEQVTPILLVNVSSLPAQHQGIILRLISKAIGECHLQNVNESTAAKYASVRETKDGEIFLEFAFHTMLYQAPISGVGCAEGLSIAQTDRITGKQPLKGSALTCRKLGILNIIEAMQLKSEASYPIFLVAASDSQESVSKRGEDLLKRKASDANLDDPGLIRTLYMIFNGTTGVENIAADLKVVPASHSLRVRMMSIFCRSITAANSFPATLQCIFGSIYGSATTLRLKQLGMEFTVWVFKHAALDQLKLMGPVILNAILRSLDGPFISEAVPKDTKAFAYQAIGLLCSRLPNLFSDKIDMAVRLFAALKLEDQSLRPSIQEALSSLATAYKGTSPEILKNIDVLLLENCQAEQNEVRFCSVRWCTTLYDLRHCSSRYICMLAASDQKIDIREMALSGLCLDNGIGSNRKLSDEKPEYPDFSEMLDFIVTKQPLLLQSSEQREGKLLFHPKTFLVMIMFLMKCFDAQFSSNEAGGKDVSYILVERICTIFEHAMAFEGSSELHATALKALVDIATLQPKLVATHYAGRFNWLKALLVHVDLDTREAASRLLGISCSAIPNSVILDFISDLLSSIKQGHLLRFENYHGFICALGYVISECMNVESIITEELFGTIIDCLVNIVESESATLAAVAMEALGHIGLRYSLPNITFGSITGGVITVMHGRLNKLLSDGDVKAVQKIIISLGHVSWHETSANHLNSALELIFTLSRSKEEDILFSAGEALSFLWGEVPVTADTILKSNYRSLSQSSNYLASDLPPANIGSSLRSDAYNESRAMAQEVITRKLFDELLFSSRKEERCSGTVWLVSLIMYCGRHPKIQQKLPEIQEVFSHLLGDSNELTQELASQGMSLAYELGDPKVKQELVNALVSSLTGSAKKKRAVKLMDDSEVFQDGVVGENLNGGKLSTYKELCGLANEMGQPDLIYKFMDLANYQAALNSKRGAAFGFSKIAKQAGDALQPQLKFLIPKLLRYQYDPDKSVQDSMMHIWKSIVPDSKKIIDEYFDAIMDDLVAQSGSRLWRSREASSLALADIIQGRRINQLSKHLRNVWVTAFRAMDDIKETVRNAGESLCRAVSSLTITLCDITFTNVQSTNEAINIVLPFLLEEGITSKVSSIQKAATNVVMRLAKAAGVALRPHLADVACCMLESLSSLEDQRLNYVVMHAENVGIRTEKLENMRIAFAKDSPMWETLDLCLNVVDTQALDVLVPRLAQLVRSGVGLNTRVGVANFITLLVQKITAEIKPYSALLLKLLFQAVIQEKSVAAKRGFASSCAVVLNYANSPHAQKLIEDSTSLHLGDQNSQLSGAVLLKAYLNFAADVVSAYSAIVYPIIFVSMFDDEKDIRTMFCELWEEIPSSERVTLQFYLVEINHLLCDCMESSSWSSKRKAAKAISKLSEILGDSLSSCHKGLLQSLLKELHGRYWEGKDTILYAITSLCLSCRRAILEDDPATPCAIISSISAACAKKVKSYREAAFSGLQKVITAFDNPKFFLTVFPNLYDMFHQNFVVDTKGESFINLSTTSGEAESGESSYPLDKILECVASCICVADFQDIISHREKIIQMLVWSFLPENNWQTKLSALSAVKQLSLKFPYVTGVSEKCSADAAFFVNELVHSLSLKVVECLKSVKIAQFHVAASESLLELMKLYKSFVPSAEGNPDLMSEIATLCQSEKNEKARTLLQGCLNILQDLRDGDTTMT